MTEMQNFTKYLTKRHKSELNKHSFSNGPPSC